MNASLYTLTDPRAPDDVRYVGWTVKSVRVRLQRHIREARSGGSSHKGRWIRSLLSIGFRPTIHTVAIIDPILAPTMEIAYIAAVRARGCALVNRTDGGDGALGYKPSAETLVKLRVSHLGKHHTAEARAKIGAASRGKTRSPETKAKIGAANLGKVRSAEVRALMSAARRGKKPSPEHVRAAAEGRRGTHRSAETRAKMSLAQRKRMADPAVRAGLSAAAMGRIITPEVRAKLSAALRGRKRPPRAPDLIEIVGED